MLSLAQRLGYSIVEMPVRWEAIPGSKVSLVWDSLNMLGCVLKLYGSHMVLRNLGAPRLRRSFRVIWRSISRRLWRGRISGHGSPSIDRIRTPTIRRTPRPIALQLGPREGGYFLSMPVGRFATAAAMISLQSSAKCRD